MTSDDPDNDGTQDIPVVKTAQCFDVHGDPIPFTIILRDGVLKKFADGGSGSGGDGSGDGAAAAESSETSEKVSDDDFDEYDDFEPGANDVFMSKLFANFLSNYRPNHAYDTILREMASRLYGNSFHRAWIQVYEKETEKYRKEHPENKFALPREVFTQDAIREFAAGVEARLPKDALAVTKSCAFLSDILELDSVETLFLQLAIKLSSNMPYGFQNLFEQFRYSDLGENTVRIFSQLFGEPEDKVQKALKGFLFQSGLLVSGSSRMKPFSVIHEDMRDAFCAPHADWESLSTALFPTNLSTELTIDDYPHLKDEIDRAEQVLRAGLEGNKRGINVMFWGVPGTGKTELALLIAQRNGWNLRVIGDVSDADNKEKSRAERIVSLKVAMKLFGRDENTILLFDEMEDLFKVDTNAQFSKAFINRIVESTQVPIIWTANDIHLIGGPVLRRMLYNIAFDVPPVEAREAMWTRYDGQYKLGLDTKVIGDLAETYDTTPALIHNAAKITQMAGLESKDVPEIVRSLDRLVHLGYERRFMEKADVSDVYDLSCINSETDLAHLEASLLAAKPNFSLLLYGEPGTGKSEFGRYITKKLKRRFIYKRASDLLGMYVGETEQNIAQMFAKAKKEEGVLLIDEGDTFLRDRGLAQRSWEVSQVNEFLSQMERHPFPLILTTNLVKDLDPAGLRRFTFRMKFDFLRPEQSERLFEGYFKMKAPASIRQMTNLTPADFNNAKKKADVLNVEDVDAIMDLLSEETVLKRERPSKIGF